MYEYVYVHAVFLFHEMSSDSPGGLLLLHAVPGVVCEYVPYNSTAVVGTPQITQEVQNLRLIFSKKGRTGSVVE